MPFIQEAETNNLKGLDLSFEPNPNTGDIATLSRYSSIRKSLEHILMFQTLEKPFREDIGSELNLFLFNVSSTADIPALRARIENTIERLEPRIKLRKLELTPQLQNHRIQLTIYYMIKQTQESDQFSSILRLSE